MTFEDNDDKTQQQIDNKMEIGACLSETLVSAREQARLTCGVYESGKQLETRPEDVMLCVLPNNSSEDVCLHIHYTLIEAFCWENDIRLIKVDCAEKLAKLLGEVIPRPPLNDNDIAAGRIQRAVVTDYNCILVQYPEAECTEVEEEVLHYHKMTCDLAPQPIIELNV